MLNELRAQSGKHMSASAAAALITDTQAPAKAACKRRWQANPAESELKGAETIQEPLESAPRGFPGVPQPAVCRTRLPGLPVCGLPPSPTSRLSASRCVRTLRNCATVPSSVPVFSIKKKPGSGAVCSDRACTLTRRAILLAQTRSPTSSLACACGPGPQARAREHRPRLVLFPSPTFSETVDFLIS